MRIEIFVVRWDSFILPIRDEVAIQIHIVFIGATKPDHPKRIQDVSKEHGSIGRQLRQAFEQLQLNRRSGKSLDAMNA